MRFIDKTGQRFNKLLVLRRLPSPNTNNLWECRCDCGRVVKVWGSHLTQLQGRCRECWRDDVTTVIVPGHVRGWLTVISMNGEHGQNRKAKCLCRCGNMCIVPATWFYDNHKQWTPSCGCRMKRPPIPAADARRLRTTSGIERDNLIDELRDRDHSQKQIADAAGISEQRVSQLVPGRRPRTFAVANGRAT